MDAEGLARALGQMRRVLRRGGLAVVTVRDYDALRAERPAVLPTHLSRSPTGLTLTVPLCEWSDEGRTYLLRQLQLEEQPDGGWRAVERRVRCRATYGRGRHGGVRGGVDRRAVGDAGRERVLPTVAGCQGALTRRRPDQDDDQDG